MSDDALKVSTKQPAITPTVEAVCAPIIYFDGLGTFGPIHNGTLVNMQLVAQRFIPTTEGKIASDLVVVAHLRCPAHVAAAMRDAISNSALIAATPVPSDRAKAN